MVKKAAYGLLAAFLAAGVYGAIPTDAEGWYKPAEFKTTKSQGSVGYLNDKGEWVECTITVSETGEVEDLGEDYRKILGDYYVYFEAARNALQSLTLAKRNKERIETIGKNLHDLTSKDGIHIKNENTGQEFTIKFGGSIATAVSGSEDEIPATSDEEDPADKMSLDWTREGKLEIKGWDTAGVNVMTPLAEAITKETKGIFENYSIVVRNGSKGLNYVSLGTLAHGGAPVDGVGITTNAADGAMKQGEASLYGWSNAAAEDIPRRGSDGHLEWKSPGDLVDGSSIAYAEVDGEKTFEVKNAHVYAGQHSRHYFGTSNDKTAALGWHELPNVTTNRVEGDGITIASTVDDQDPGIKRLGLLGWNRSCGGDPLFVVNAGGSIGYIPLPALTNLAACACTQKWDNVTEWIGGGAAVDEGGGLTLPGESLDSYLFGTLGYIYSTTADNLYFDNDGENIRASFDAPENWADGDSVELTDEGAYQIKGFADAGACRASVSAMLSSPEGSDATTHLLLAKKTDTGELHYVAIGRGVQSGAAVDDATITTNTAHGAVTSGIASIYGWSSAANDTYLSKNAGGSLEWRTVSQAATLYKGTDNSSVLVGSGPTTNTVEFASAEDSSISVSVSSTETGVMITLGVHYR